MESSNKYAMLQRTCMDLMSSSTNEGKFCATVAMNLLKLYEVSYYYLVHAVIVSPCAPPPLRTGGVRAPLPPCFRRLCMHVTCVQVRNTHAMLSRYSFWDYACYVHVDKLLLNIRKNERFHKSEEHISTCSSQYKQHPTYSLNGS